jgi:hypothetical protein
VVYYEDSHFPRTQPAQMLPHDIIQPTASQIQAIDKIVDILIVEDREEAEQALKYTVRRLYLALICYIINSILFQLPVLSFYTILSRKI